MLREAMCNELNKAFSRLEDYVCRTEARNFELEKTTRTLKRKIYVLESEPSAQCRGTVTRDSNDVGRFSSTNNLCDNPSQCGVIDDSKKSQDYPGSTDQLVIGL